MIKLQFKIDVASSAQKAFQMMLGIPDKNTYRQWTAIFNDSSTYEGSWEKGSKILFTGTDEHGNRGGMVSRIVENITNAFVSIQHIGILEGDTEITSGPKVEPWAGCMENYTFTGTDQNTIITIEIDVVEEYLDYFNTTYPKALDALKRIIEEN